MSVQLCFANFCIGCFSGKREEEVVSETTEENASAKKTKVKEN